MADASFVSTANNKKVLYCAIVIFFLPYVIFSFWNFPAADDYMIIARKNEFSFWQLQTSLYHNWTGRYFATFVSSIFSYNGFLYSHYYLHSILLFILTILAWLFCLFQINEYFLQKLLSTTTLVVVSLLLLVLEIIVVPEPVTAFYWFSSAITYQLPLILLIFLSGVIIKLLLTRGNEIFYLVTAAFIIIMLNGCNEVITLFVIVNSSVGVAYCMVKKKKLPAFIIGLYTLIVISALFLLFSPGILKRSSTIGGGLFIPSVGIGIIKLVVLHWFFLKEPLWWFCVFCVTLFFSNNSAFTSIINHVEKEGSPGKVLGLYVISGLLVYVPILFITNGSLPLRAENIICYLYGLILLFILSIYVSSKIKSGSSLLYKFRFLLLSILIFASINTKNLTYSLLSGYFYKQVMLERLRLFKSAKTNGENQVTFDSYENAVNKRLLNFPFFNRQLLKVIFLKPPPIICFESDVYDLKFIQEFYGVKTVNLH